jgi:hypothetical protein
MAQWTTTYTGLVALLETYVEDTSDEFDNNVQGLINRAEERILRDLDLGLWTSDQTVSTAIGTATVTKPTAAHVLKALYYGTTPVLRRAREFVDMYGGSGVPLYFHEEETRLRFAPVPDAVYALTAKFLNRPTPLSSSNETNWFTDKCADLLLNAVLVESERFLIAPERSQEFEATYAGLLNALRAHYRDAAERDYEPIQPTAAVAQNR